MSHLMEHEALFYSAKSRYSQLILFTADRAVVHLQYKYTPLNYYKILACM